MNHKLRCYLGGKRAQQNVGVTAAGKNSGLAIQVLQEDLCAWLLKWDRGGTTVRPGLCESTMQPLCMLCDRLPRTHDWVSLRSKGQDALCVRERS